MMREMKGDRYIHEERWIYRAKESKLELNILLLHQYMYIGAPMPPAPSATRTEFGAPLISRLFLVNIFFFFGAPILMAQGISAVLVHYNL